MVSQKLARPDYPIPEGHNYGVVATDQVCILDIDNGEKFYALFSKELNTYAVKTRRGAHYYFLQTAASRRLGNVAAACFDFQASKFRYVVGEGSIHPSGHVYRCLKDLPLTEIPDELVIAMSSAKRRVAAGGERSGRHGAILSWCAKNWKGPGHEDELVEGAIAFDQEHNDPPRGLQHATECAEWYFDKEPYKEPVRFSVGEGKSKVKTARKTFSELRREAEESVPEIIGGLLPSSSANILVGESGIGKTPLLAQMNLCTAAGIPFLGMPTTRSKVLVVDYENDGNLFHLYETLYRFLGTTIDDEWMAFLQNPNSVEEVIGTAEDFGAGLISVDALRGLDPRAETKSEAAADLIRRLQDYRACWTVMHHPRKADRQAPPPNLEDEKVRVLSWLQEAAGMRALVNQTSTRIAVSESERAALLMRGYRKMKGETPFIYIERVNDDGVDVGYKVATGTPMLSLNHKAWFQKVAGRTFRFLELVTFLDAHHSQVTRFVGSCLQAGLAQEEGVRRSKSDPWRAVFADAAEMQR